MSLMPRGEFWSMVTCLQEMLEKGERADKRGWEGRKREKRDDRKEADDLVDVHLGSHLTQLKCSLHTLLVFVNKSNKSRRITMKDLQSQ